MRRFGAWGISLALLSALCVPAGGAEPPLPVPEVRSSDVGLSVPWYRRLFGGTQKPKTQIVPVSPQAGRREAAAKTLSEEQAVYLQRLAVCTRLREIALLSGDDGLVTQADDLEKQATELYHKKVAHLPGSRLTSLSAEARLDAKLGTGVATDPMRSAATKSEGDEKSARGSRVSARREEKP
jgi:hypothetical protein